MMSRVFGFAPLDITRFKDQDIIGEQGESGLRVCRPNTA